MTRSRKPDWQLPRGVTRGLWQYAHAEHIAVEYDEYFALNRLFEYDEQVLLDEFREPGVLVDLGCGTGRLLVPFARREFTCVGVDLSAKMLRVVGEKAAGAGVVVHRVQANMVELECLRDASADYVVCMFSSLGMVRGRANRRRVLEHARRILKPGGRFALHAHNRWYNLREAQGRWWLVANAVASLVRRDVEPGDKRFDYRGIPGMFLHTFTKREVRRALRRAGFRIERTVPLDTTRQRPLPAPWLLNGLRANGWIFLCRTDDARQGDPT